MLINLNLNNFFKYGANNTYRVGYDEGKLNHFYEVISIELALSVSSHFPFPHFLLRYRVGLLCGEGAVINNVSVYFPPTFLRQEIMKMGGNKHPLF